MKAATDAASMSARNMMTPPYGLQHRALPSDESPPDRHSSPYTHPAPHTYSSPYSHSSPHLQPYAHHGQHPGHMPPHAGHYQR